MDDRTTNNVNMAPGFLTLSIPFWMGGSLLTCSIAGVLTGLALVFRRRL